MAVVKADTRKLDKVNRNDTFTILAAILDFQVSEMLNSNDEQVTATRNPLLYRNKDNKIVFINFDDLQKFSVKFIKFK